MRCALRPRFDPPALPVFAALVVSLWPTLAPGQSERFVRGRHMLPESSQSAFLGDASAADFDGDGEVDVVVAGSELAVWMGAGAGLFVEGFSDDSIVTTYEDVCVLDADGNGTLDLALAVLASCNPGGPDCAFGENELWSGDGTGGFVDVSAGTPGDADGRTRAVVAGDLSGDGHPDLVWGNDLHDPFGGPAVGGVDVVWTNDGLGGFVASQPFVARPTRTLALADVDGDGHLDLYAGDSRSRLFLNDGAGNLVESAQVLPETEEPSDAVFLDVDQNGSLDLVVAYDTNTDDVRLFRNTGGLFAHDAAALPAFEARDVAAADFDGDGVPDLLANGRFEVRLLSNDGGGVFTTLGSLPGTGVDALPARESLAEDLDGDGDADVLLVAGSGSQVFLGDDSGGMTRVTNRVPWEPGFPAGARLFDADGDGDLDAAVVHGPSSRSDLFLNDGAGAFARGGPDDWNDTSGMTDLDVGDMDEDGDLDLVAPDVFNEFEAGLYTNVAGSFTRSFPFPGTAGARFVAVADLGGNGRTDVVLGAVVGPQAFQNDGGGAFSDASSLFPAGAFAHGDLVFGDYQNDGDPDLFVAGPFGQRRLYRNDAGSFADASGVLPSFPAHSRALGLGDVDGDGELDVLVGTGSNAASPPNGLFLSDGLGGFVDASGNLPALAQRTTAVLVQDFDSDGDGDVFFVNEFGNTLFDNDGSGLFVDASAGLPAVVLRGKAGSAGDLDDDGDADVFVGSTMGPDVLFNTARGQLAEGLPARIGQDVPLVIRGPASGSWWVLYSPDTLRIQVGTLGILRLGTVGLELVGSGALDAGGQAQLDAPVPDDVALIGTTLYIQSLLAPPLRLGNLETVVPGGF